MPSGKKPTQNKLHPRNLHNSRYDLQALVEVLPELKPYIFTNQYETETINFSDPKAVKALNKALLKKHYSINFWDIPDGFLCPPIPGRADYLHYLADLLFPKTPHLPKNSKIKILDIGTGANIIYPLLGQAIYGLKFVATETNASALANAQEIISKNPNLEKYIEVRKQDFGHQIFKGVVKDNERFEAVMCNPPFHKSAEEAMEASSRKAKNLYNDPKAKLNFGGGPEELWCPGGEFTFIKNMVKESLVYQNQILWFTSIVSKSENIIPIERVMQRSKVNYFKWVEMAQGNKKSRFIAWTFQSKKDQKEWITP
ncbi:23S rRNA (adenine(1618)-N(6))-methyltransferase RlmF [Algoriphagus namhaensis]|uniref:Ribosomal RNA large subunit methyltransferase F n=1 Tax=Algoriphagus namhaensis TaxID=915353 RepID=A0ABV8AP32_9BACT